MRVQNFGVGSILLQSVEAAHETTALVLIESDSIFRDDSERRE
jgi:hypothetical protein